MTDIKTGQMVLINGIMRACVASITVTREDLRRGDHISGDPLISGDDKVPAGTTVYHLSDSEDDYWYTRDQFELMEAVG